MDVWFRYGLSLRRGKNTTFCLYALIIYPIENARFHRDFFVAIAFSILFIVVVFHLKTSSNFDDISSGTLSNGRISIFFMLAFSLFILVKFFFTPLCFHFRALHSFFLLHLKAVQNDEKQIIKPEVENGRMLLDFHLSEQWCELCRQIWPVHKANGT